MAEGELEALVGAKFEYLCTCQIYGKLKASSKAADLWKARGIDELLRQFSPHLKVGYVEGPVKEADGDAFYSCLLGIDAHGAQQVQYMV